MAVTYENVIAAASSSPQGWHQRSHNQNGKTALLHYVVLTPDWVLVTKEIAVCLHVAECLHHHHAFYRLSNVSPRWRVCGLACRDAATINLRFFRLALRISFYRLL